MEQLNVGYYAIIPATVRYDENIPANAKLLYGEITALCNKEGFCWATNDYFSKLYGFTKQSISRLISKLEEAGYIRTDIEHSDNNAILRRCISIADPLTEKTTPLNKKDNTPYQKSLYPLTKKIIPLTKKVKENNTNNTTSNTTSNKYINNNINNNTKSDIEQKEKYENILSQIENDELRELYLEYIEMRKNIKSPMTERALKILIGRVDNLEKDVERKKKLLEVAILNNWKNVYPLKEDDKVVCNENNKYAGVMDSIRAKRRNRL